MVDEYIQRMKKWSDKPLHIFERDLQKLKKLRNDSAHVGMGRIPDVEWVRTYLWQGICWMSWLGWHLEKYDLPLSKVDEGNKQK